MKDTRPAPQDHDETELYEIRITGHLDDRWAAWFTGMTITRDSRGETLLSGTVVDQAALHSLLRKVRDLALPLISVVRVRPGAADMSDTTCCGEAP